MAATRINYDMLDYLPGDMETVQGQNILLEDFGKGAFSFVIVEGMPDRDVAALREKISGVDHVESVLWYDSILDLSVPKEMLPDEIYGVFNAGDATMMAVFFDTATSADETMEAVTQIRTLAGEAVLRLGPVGHGDGPAEPERGGRRPPMWPLAVACACLVMVLLLDSWLAPFVFLASLAWPFSEYGQQLLPG